MTVIQAPLGAIDRMRRTLVPGHVLVTIEHLLIVTWRIPIAEMRGMLPPALEPVVDGNETLISAVLFRNRDLRPARIGLLRLSSFQMNVRSYVRDPATGEPGSVYFHGLYLSRRWIAKVSASLFNVPFAYLPFGITVADDDRLEWSARDRNGRVDVSAVEADAPLDSAMVDLLTNPHTGYFADRSGALRKWSIWHRPQQLRTVRIVRARLADLPLGESREAWKALYVRSVDYEVYLPSTPAS